MKLQDITLKTNFVSFTRSLQCTDAVFQTWNTESPRKQRYVEVTERSLQGQTSYSASKDSTKEVKKGALNIQNADIALIPLGCDRLSISFSFRCFPFVQAPDRCSDSEVSDSFREIAKRYSDMGGFKYLAALYLENVANARFAFRNLVIANFARVTISCNATSVVFDPFAMSLDGPAGEASFADQIKRLQKGLYDQGARPDMEEIIDMMAAGFQGEHQQSFQVQFLAEVQELEQVWPSEVQSPTLWKRPGADDGPRAKSRTLSSASVMQDGEKIRAATFTSNKIGNALRTIDIWHMSENHGPQPVNPYAGVRATGEVLRPGGKGATVPSLFDILEAPKTHLKSLFSRAKSAEINPQVHYLFACLVRGGIYGIK